MKMEKRLLKKCSLEEISQTCKSEFVKTDFKPVWKRYKCLFWDLEAKSGFLMSTFKIHHFLESFFFTKSSFSFKGGSPMYSQIRFSKLP